jgi:hypothetical protein
MTAKKPRKSKPRKIVFSESWDPEEVAKQKRRIERFKKRKKLKAKTQRRFGRGCK